MQGLRKLAFHIGFPKRTITGEYFLARQWMIKKWWKYWTQETMVITHRAMEINPVHPLGADLESNWYQSEVKNVFKKRVDSITQAGNGLVLAYAFPFLFFLEILGKIKDYSSHMKKTKMSLGSPQLVVRRNRESMCSLHGKLSSSGTNFMTHNHISFCWVQSQSLVLYP